MARWQEVGAFVSGVFWPFRKSRLKTMAALVVGLLRQREVGLAGIAQGMLDGTTVKHRVKRIGRFLGNRQVEAWEVTRHLLAALMPPDRQSVLVVDWTDRREYMLLKLSLVLHRRALPLAWRHVEKWRYEKSQNAVEEELVVRVAKLIGPKRPWVLVADRGFGRAELFRTLEEAGIRFVIRDADDVWVKMEGFEGRLWDLPRQRGKAVLYRNITYHRRQHLRLHLVVAHAEPAAAPWFLVTNLELDPVLVQRLYAKRMWIEAGIRDCKSGLQLKRLWLSEPERMDRMMIVVAIAMVLLVLTGVASRARREDPQVTTSKRKAPPASVFTLGCRVLHLYPERLCTHVEVLYAI